MLTPRKRPRENQNLEPRSAKRSASCSPCLTPSHNREAFDETPSRSMLPSPQILGMAATTGMSPLFGRLGVVNARMSVPSPLVSLYPGGGATPQTQAGGTPRRLSTLNLDKLRQQAIQQTALQAALGSLAQDQSQREKNSTIHQSEAEMATTRGALTGGHFPGSLREAEHHVRDSCAASGSATPALRGTHVSLEEAASTPGGFFTAPGTPIGYIAEQDNRASLPKTNLPPGMSKCVVVHSTGWSPGGVTNPRPKEKNQPNVPTASVHDDENQRDKTPEKEKRKSTRRRGQYQKEKEQAAVMTVMPGGQPEGSPAPAPAVFESIEESSSVPPPSLPQPSAKVQQEPCEQEWRAERCGGRARRPLEQEVPLPQKIDASRALRLLDAMTTLRAHTGALLVLVAVAWLCRCAHPLTEAIVATVTGPEGALLLSAEPLPRANATGDRSSSTSSQWGAAEARTMSPGVGQIGNWTGGARRGALQEILVAWTRILTWQDWAPPIEAVLCACVLGWMAVKFRRSQLLGALLAAGVSMAVDPTTGWIPTLIPTLFADPAISTAVALPVLAYIVWLQYQCSLECPLIGLFQMSTAAWFYHSGSGRHEEDWEQGADAMLALLIPLLVLPAVFSLPTALYRRQGRAGLNCVLCGEVPLGPFPQRKLQLELGQPRPLLPESEGRSLCFHGAPGSESQGDLSIDPCSPQGLAGKLTMDGAGAWSREFLAVLRRGDQVTMGAEGSPFGCQAHMVVEKATPTDAVLCFARGHPKIAPQTRFTVFPSWRQSAAMACRAAWGLGQDFFWATVVLCLWPMCCPQWIGDEALALILHQATGVAPQARWLHYGPLRHAVEIAQRYQHPGEAFTPAQLETETRAVLARLFPAVEPVEGDETAVEAWHFQYRHPPRPVDLSRLSLSSVQWEAVEKVARAAWASSACKSGEGLPQDVVADEWVRLGTEHQNEWRHRMACCMKLLCLNHKVVTAPPAAMRESSPGLWHDRSLLDRIAQDSHDRWALGKLREGYCYGPVRCSVLQLEPLLLEFSRLDSHVTDRYRDQAAVFLRRVAAAGLTAHPLR